jgi:hypothetical protein
MASTNDLGRGCRERLLPGRHLSLGGWTHEGSVSLSQEAAIAAHEVEIGRPEEEDEAVQKRPPPLRRTGYQIAVLGGQCEDREELEIALDIHTDAVDTKISRNRRPDVDRLFETMQPVSDHDLPLEPKAVTIVAHDPPKMGGPEGAQIAKYNKCFQETRLAGAVRAQHNIGGGAETVYLRR